MGEGVGGGADFALVLGARGGERFGVGPIHKLLLHVEKGPSKARKRFPGTTVSGEGKGALLKAFTSTFTIDSINVLDYKIEERKTGCRSANVLVLCLFVFLALMLFKAQSSPSPFYVHQGSQY